MSFLSGTINVEISTIFICTGEREKRVEWKLQSNSTFSFTNRFDYYNDDCDHIADFIMA